MIAHMGDHGTMMEHMTEHGMMGGTMLIWLALVIWFVVFSILVLVKLGKIVDLLEKK